MDEADILCPGCGAALDGIVAEMLVAAREAGTPNGGNDHTPVTVDGERIHISDSEMEVDRFYLAPYKGRTLAIRKNLKGKVDVYRLPR